MKLLLDENLSLGWCLHCRLTFLAPARCRCWVWNERRTQLCEYAARNGYVLRSKDDDFQRLMAARAYQPRFVHLALGNASNDAVLTVLLAAAGRLHTAFDDPATGLVVIE